MTLRDKRIDFLYMVATGSSRVRNLFTPLFICANYRELKAIEEPELVKRLGEAYVAYRKMTPMFFPCRKRKIKGERP
ncbi:MAG: hypothetical protein V2I56_17035 [Desulfobacteraceae bacterium]|jgi:protein-S-isoprenylcysteine O-methyltransferase Ste14|nr:hypothetical protein [Desulfobacteraceae bacterium]